MLMIDENLTGQKIRDEARAIAQESRALRANPDREREKILERRKEFFRKNVGLEANVIARQSRMSDLNAIAEDIVKTKFKIRTLPKQLVVRVEKPASVEQPKVGISQKLRADEKRRGRLLLHAVIEALAVHRR